MESVTAGQRIMMCPPRHFRVDYVINPWMASNVGRTSPELAAQQWQALHKLIAARASISLIEPDPACPDMVFTANAGTIVGDIAVPSRFFHAERQGEEAHFKRWFSEHGFQVEELSEDITFEGAGDTLLDRGGPWLWASYGMRTDLRSHRHLARIFDIEVLSLRLVDSRFYHLDTCFCPLPGGALLYYPMAFDAASLSLIEERVPESKRIAVGEADALNFVCNAVVVGGAAIVHKASAQLREALLAHGLETIETPLSEFLMSGGSSKCLTLKLDESAGGGAAIKTAAEPLTRIVEFEGHLLDSGSLSRALDAVVEAGGSFHVESFTLGETRALPSRAMVEVQAPTPPILRSILERLIEQGGRPQGRESIGELDRSATLEAVTQAGVAPDDFYATTIYPTEVCVAGRWLPVSEQRMDAVIVVNGEGDALQARCVLLRDLQLGDRVVTGIEGVRIGRETDIGRAAAAIGGSTKPKPEFAFMASGVSSERRVELAVNEVAWQLHRLREQGGKAVVVAGPVVIHAGGGPHLADLIREGYIGALLAGNALAVHDIEAALYGTSLGVDLHRGGEVEGGHRNHLRAINRIRRCGGIAAAVGQGVLTRGIFFECVRHGLPYSLAGSIRDDGPLPDTQMDLVAAQADYARLLRGSSLTLMLSTMLHSIGAGNMTPAGVKLVCVDINPAVVTKLADRGSLESVGVVTDVGLFLKLVAERVEELASG